MACTTLLRPISLNLGPKTILQNKIAFSFILLILSALVTYSLMKDHEDSSSYVLQRIPRSTNCIQSEATSFMRIKHLDPLDERVLAHIRCYHLAPPTNLRLNLEKPYVEQSLFAHQIQVLLGSQMNGFFVESGAGDGEFRSSTLGLEMDLNWTGLLIEPQPKYYKKLLLKNRNAWFANVCLSPNRRIMDMEHLRAELDAKPALNPGTLRFQNEGDDSWYGTGALKSYRGIRCFPLESILAAMKIQTVDFLRLRLEGTESKVLKSLSLDDTLKIKVILLDYSFDPEGKDEMRDWLAGKGYSVAHEGRDNFIFVQK